MTYASAGNYQVIITNSYGSVTSSVAQLIIDPLDLTFNGTGKVTTGIGSADDFGYSVAIQADGKIVVAGSANNGANIDVAVARYNTNGTLDTTFNGTGKVTSDFGGQESIYGVALQSDGKIVVSGGITGLGKDNFLLARYTTNGVLDSTFGTGGKVFAAIGTGSDVGEKLTIQNDGKIVVAGFSYNGSDYDFAVARFLTNGTFDTTFNSTGHATTPVGNGDDQAYGVQVQSDGKIVIAGRSSNGGFYDFALARFTANGILDTAFNGTGKVITPIGSGHGYAYGVALQSDGKIVAGGRSYNGTNYDFAAVRYTTNGVLDTTFNGTGKASADFNGTNDYGFEIKVQSDGKIVVAGLTYDYFALTRFNSDGSLDSSLGFGGKITTIIGGTDDTAFGLAIQNDGKIVVAGYSFNGANYDFAVVRYNNNVPPAITAQVQNQTVVASSNAIFTVTASGTPPYGYQWYLNGVAITGATGSSLTVSNVTYSNQGGNYSVVITNSYGSVTSCVAALNVMDVVKSFGGALGTNSFATLVEVTPGTFYGTTESGGANGVGTLFKFTSSGTFTTLAPFTSTAGKFPRSLTLGPDGNLYGLAVNGGILNNGGTVFRATTNGTLTAITNFNSSATTGPNGYTPLTELMLSSDGNFYGTTYAGGTSDNGTLFKVTTNGALTTLLSLPGTAGANPYASPVQGGDGALYLTTRFGGNSGDGTVFKASTNVGSPTFLTSFMNVATGRNPLSGVVFGSDGFLYGCGRLGGNSAYGTIYKTTTSGVLTKLFDFSGGNGKYPLSVIFGPDGNLYGVTDQGGDYDLGTVFKFSTNGVLTTLLSFNGTNGSHPASKLLFASDGYAYGTTYDGGTNNSGVIYRLRYAPTIVTQPADVTAECGTVTNLSVQASGNAPLAYQWLKAGTPISGATNTVYPLTLGPGFAGAYNVIVSNNFGSITSSVATVTVLDTTPPTISLLVPSNQTTNANASCQATVPDFRGSVGWVDCSGYVQSIGQTPAPGTVVGLGSTLITLSVTDGSNNVASTNLNLTVLDVTPPNILTCATNMTIALGNFATTTLPDLRGQIVATDCGSSVTVSQSPAPGTVIGIGATTVTLFAYDTAGNTNTCTATVTGVATPPSILVAPGNVVAAPGGSATFTVGALGTPPFTYQWQLNGVNIPGANASSYNVPNADGTNAGSYTVIICNAADCVTSSAGTLTLLGLDIHPVLHIYGPIGATYRVDYSEDLGSPTNWNTITNFALPSSPYLFPDPTPARQVKRFYRAVKQ